MYTINIIFHYYFNKKLFMANLEFGTFAMLNIFITIRCCLCTKLTKIFNTLNLFNNRKLIFIVEVKNIHINCLIISKYFNES